MAAFKRFHFNMKDSRARDMNEIKSNVLELTVSELAGKLKRTVEDTFGHVRVRGEISGYRGPHASGHSYFSIKDDKARLEAVIWRGVAARLKHLPEEGLEVIASGKLTIYPGSSKYQIVIDTIEPAGAGALMALLEERRRKLAAEGLFAENRKQLLPFMPRVIGVVTSPTGAVIRDILHRLADRYPLHVLVWPVRVQGETSGAEVANGIRQFNALPEGGALPRPDVIIVARGGGSLEDLWGFNDEALVRAAAGSMIPLISAVGHETDWTLLDYAADWRAPTPTAAAEKAVPVKAELEAQLADFAMRLRRAQTRWFDTCRSDLRALARVLPTPDSLLALPRRRFDEASGRLDRALSAYTANTRSRFSRVAPRLSHHTLAERLIAQRERLTRAGRANVLGLRNLNARKRAMLDTRTGRLSPRFLMARLAQNRAHLHQVSDRFARAYVVRTRFWRSGLEKTGRLLDSLSYQNVLDRGYAVIRDAARTPLTSAADLHAGRAVRIEMGDGAAGAMIDNNAPGKVVGKKPIAKPQKKRAAGKRAAKTPAGEQGSLF